ncbi:hypothetical protein [Aquimarina muelleri]|uniref:Uncharacterized protein n=1 Tax=Aquimarina muelleri TaxID=279356 RepID=A0A918JW90_9FLAO|nr:hypothetical protein [Aquimarina muelleri]MCX2764420.1 hypothetical protein [Aquimarina muelleri]GGX21221.1 hypothetical protein GCM10007384_23050 [Aquimarina muelleri]
MKIRQPINKSALIIAIASFILGTILLLFFIISPSNILVDIGLFYILIAIVLNTITCIELITNSFINYQHNKENLITILLITLNIPIAIGYIIIVLNNPFNNLL